MTKYGGNILSHLTIEIAPDPVTDPLSVADNRRHEDVHIAEVFLLVAGLPPRGFLDTVNARHFSDKYKAPVSSPLCPPLCLRADQILQVGWQDVEVALLSEEPTAVNIGCDKKVR